MELEVGDVNDTLTGEMLLSSSQTATELARHEHVRGRYGGKNIAEFSGIIST